MNKPKVIFLPHANIQYSQLAPEKREKVYERRVLKNAELILFDTLSVGKHTVEYVESFLFRFVFGFILKIVPVESVHF